MKQNTGYLLLITAAASLGGLLFGYDTGVINGTQFFFSKFFDLDAAAKGWAVSSALLGCVGGAIISGLLSSRIGRKNSLILSAVLFTFSAYGSGVPAIDQFNLLILFRILGGIGIGIASMNAPTYIAEIAPSDKRGTLVTYYQLAIVIGFFVVFLATYFIGQDMSETENIQDGWRYMFWSELIPSFLFLGLMFLAPKSPRWLALKGRDNEAKEVLMKIYRDDVVVNKEFSQIKDSLDRESSSVKKSVLAKGAITIVIIGTVLSALQQFTGINAVFYYGADIFESALGMGKDQVLQQQILLAGVNLVFTFIAMFTVDKIGRKPLLTIGGVGMLLGFLLMGWTLYSSDYSTIKITNQIKTMPAASKLADGNIVDVGDGIKFLGASKVGGIDTLGIKTTTDQYVNVWFDFNGNGTKDDMELIADDVEMPIGDHKIPIKIPSHVATTPIVTYVEFAKPSIDKKEGILCLLGILIFIGAFAMSMGPIVWVMLSEMFPNNIRSAAMSIAVAAQWIANAFISGTFPSVVESQANGLKLMNGFWNNSLPYFLFSAFILFIIFFVTKYIPETKGKSLEEVEAMWEEKFDMKF